MNEQREMWTQRADDMLNELLDFRSGCRADLPTWLFRRNETDLTVACRVVAGIAESLAFDSEHPGEADDVD